MRVENSGNNNIVKIENESKINGRLVIKGDNNDVLIHLSSGDALDIYIEGDFNSLYLDGSRIGRLRAILKNSGEIEIDEQTTIEEAYILADSMPVKIGKDCMLSFQVQLRTTDAHGIYDLKEGVLLNPPQEIIIKDHVWVGQGVLISKGTIIESDSVIVARSFLQKDIIPANSIAAGSPARIIRKEVTWRRDMHSINKNHDESLS